MISDANCVMACRGAFASGVFVPPKPGHKKHLLGTDLCTRGPGHWCQNLTTAADCHATKHCIQTVWIHQTLPPDGSSVCQICLDMVKQARDQLESNETQELIKEVFEGSCALLHVKHIVKECDKIADDYIPDLIDTLASQMNPQVVCSVAGLCNNDRVKKLLEEADEEPTPEVIPGKVDKCKGCHEVVDILDNKFNKMSRDEFLHGLLNFCGKFSSFSDGCSNLVITYFTEIYNHLQQHLNSEEVCLFSGECSAQFHAHRARVEITPNSHIGYVPVGDVKDDVPCQLCEQLVDHLRNLLVANTTEDEFKRVLEGLCKQTGKFSEECVELVDQYYGEVYTYLVDHLNATEVCDQIGICKVTKEKEDLYIAPLLENHNAEKALEISSESKPEKVDTSALSEVNLEQQLPIDLLMPPHTQVLYNKELCAFCEYFLHYVQIALTDPKTENEIKLIIEKACKELPISVNDTCISFVDMYEPALVALLDQAIDPSQVCPMIRVCPSSKSGVEVFMEAKSDSKCPLCLVAVTKLEEMVSNNKSEAQIKAALEKLCKVLPQTIDNQCETFVEKYTDHIVEMLLADLTPEEVCVALHLCTDNRPANPLPPYVVRQIGGNIETNVIPDNTVNGQIVIKDKVHTGSVGSKPECILCEFVMKEIEDQLKDKSTDAEIETVVKGICKIMPSSVKQDCNKFVDQYADTVIQLLIAALEPSKICSYIKLCEGSQMDMIKVQILECPVCEMAVEVMEKILSNPNIDHEITHVIEKTCRGLPAQYRSQCVKIVDAYGEEMIDLIVHQGGKTVCRKVGYCKSSLGEVVID
ncbi:unnamed protein product [Diabrotica balteata]|uniref:Saposin n=1 Tax=Diabrotica balteata TaxID=107213 RepID=A0A9N9X958_DIABA|nr:unnamed protein product [Diabrotica balteata]